MKAGFSYVVMQYLTPAASRHLTQSETLSIFVVRHKCNGVF